MTTSSRSAAEHGCCELVVSKQSKLVQNRCGMSKSCSAELEQRLQ